MGETTWKKTFNEPDTTNNTKTDEKNESFYDDILRMEEKIKNINNRRNAREYTAVRENYKNIELFQSIYQKMNKNNNGEESSEEEYDPHDAEGYANFNEDDSDDDSIDGRVLIEGMKSKKKKKKKSSTAATARTTASGTTASGTTASGTTASGTAASGTTASGTTASGTTASGTAASGTAASGTKKTSNKKNKFGSLNDLWSGIASGFAMASMAINNFLFYMPNIVDKTLSEGTNNFASMYSEKNAPPNQVKKDANIVKDFIYQLVSFTVAIWVAFNGFFLMIYKEGGVEICGTTKDENGRCHVANDESRLKINFEKTGRLRSILEFLFDFAITPLWAFDKYVMGDNYGKKTFTYVPWKIISHFIILVLSFFLVYSYNFFTTLRQTINGKLGTVNVLAITAIGVLYFYKIYKTLTTDDLKGMMMKTVSPLAWMFMTFLYFVILLGIAAISVNISVILLVLFVWFMAMFSIPYYKGANGISRIIENINKYISEDFDNSDEACQDVSIIQKILRMIARGLHKNMYYVGFMGLMASNLIRMNTALSSGQLRQIMTAIIVPLIGIMASFIWGNGATPKTGIPKETKEMFDNLKNAVNISDATK